MRKFDMHLGVRFHGSVMSTLAEVPTMILSGDLRVKEFVDYHKLPSMDIFELEDGLKPEDIYEKIDYTEYSNRYDYLKSNYINFLSKNGINFIR
jgi:polysaccharide pyruvyl transferase WcaK-like protein